MKRLISIFLSAVLFAACLFSFAACGEGSKIEGRYVSSDGFLVYEFSSRELTRSDKLVDFDTVYSYRIESKAGNRYIYLTLKGYSYDGENASVAAYVESENKKLEGKEQTEERLYFTEAEDGTLKIGKKTFIKQD